MNLDPLLLEVLACPCEHHAPVAPAQVIDVAAGEFLVCRRCQTRFPVRDDIPVMLLDEAIPGPQGIGAELSA